MATSILPSMPFPLATPTPAPRRWTCVEFHRLGDEGWFEGRRAMLIDGEILEMPGPNPPHAAINAKIDYTLREHFRQGFVIRNQSPLVLGQTTDPEPDLAVVTGKVMDYFQAHPTTAVLVVEVADSTLDFDLTTKASLYAAAGIGDYWVVDLLNRRVVLHRSPHADPGAPFKWRYADVKTLVHADSVSPLAMPSASIAVSELLP